MSTFSPKSLKAVNFVYSRQTNSEDTLCETDKHFLDVIPFLVLSSQPGMLSYLSVSVLFTRWGGRGV